MNIYDVAFFSSFVVCLGIVFYRAWNLFHLCKISDIKITFLLFSIFIIGHFIQFSIVMVQHERVIYLIFYYLNNFFMVFNVVELIAEIFFSLGWFMSGGRSAFKDTSDKANF
jgi:hypothetical protein